MLTDEQLRAIRERAERATPGEWRLDYGEMSVYTDDADVANDVITSANLEFIAASRQDVPALLATVAELQARVKVLEAVAEAEMAWIRAEAQFVQGEYPLSKLSATRKAAFAALEAAGYGGEQK